MGVQQSRGTHSQSVAGSVASNATIRPGAILHRSIKDNNNCDDAALSARVWRMRRVELTGG